MVKDHWMPADLMVVMMPKHMCFSSQNTSFNKHYDNGLTAPLCKGAAETRPLSTSLDPDLNQLLPPITK